MKQPQALLMSWWQFDVCSPTEREALRDEVERYFAEMDLLVYKVHLGEAHPNEDYEYQPLEAVIKRKGNY